MSTWSRVAKSSSKGPSSDAWFWLEHIKRGVLNSALDSNPSAAEVFFGPLPAFRRDLRELTEIAVARHWLSLSKEELMMDVIRNELKTLPYRAAYLNADPTRAKRGWKLTSGQINAMTAQLRRHARAVVRNAGCRM